MPLSILKKRELVLDDSTVAGILLAARTRQERDYLIIALMAYRGLRIGEIVGERKLWRFKRKNGEEVSGVSELPGILREDIREWSVWVRGKGGRIDQLRLPTWLYEDLRAYVRNKKYWLSPKNRLFDITERQVYRLCLDHAKKVGVQDWVLVHPHRFRHYFITRVHRLYKDPHTTKSLARHVNFITTLRYIADLSPEEEAVKIEALERPKGFATNP